MSADDCRERPRFQTGLCVNFSPFKDRPFSHRTHLRGFTRPSGYFHEIALLSAQRGSDSNLPLEKWCGVHRTATSNLDLDPKCHSINFCPYFNKENSQHTSGRYQPPALEARRQKSAAQLEKNGIYGNLEEG